MTEVLKQCEGQVVNGAFQLRQYLGGSEHHAVFLTEYGEQQPQKAAIKIIRVDPRNAELQLSNWVLAARLFHPHLIRLFRMGRCYLGDMGLVYVVMEYAEENLSQVLPHRSLTPAETCEMLGPALEALAFIHGAGFVHGHMKPANIMAVDDKLKISSDALCRTGESHDPGVYDPPELVVRGMSPAGDVWSLGVTVIQALTQQLPVWEGTEPVLPETVPAPQLDIVRHCLRRDPGLRWTAAQCAARLRQTSAAPSLQATDMPRKAFTKWRYVVPAVATGLAAVLVVPRLINRSSDAQRLGLIAPAPASLRAEPEVASSSRAVPGVVVKQVLPSVPRKARNTIRGTVPVSVRLQVDSSGRVVGAEIDSPGPSRYFARQALEAARHWEFDAAKLEGRNVSSTWKLRFGFSRTGTKVLPVQEVP